MIEISPRRIGIYSGTFDPVHVGHIAFAMQALEAANLDKVYFLPERRPREKNDVEHFAHRVAMIKQAIKPHPQFDIIELVDISFSIERTLPKLKAIFAGDDLVFLMGSDVIRSLPNWPKSERLLRKYEIVVGLRTPDNPDDIKDYIDSWTVKPESMTMFDSFAPDISSGKVRESLRKGHPVAGTLKSVERYSDHNWLYISLNIDKS
jgi:nicotinate-nucleotide adenylyltransferase